MYIFRMDEICGDALRAEEHIIRLMRDMLWTVIHVAASGTGWEE